MSLKCLRCGADSSWIEGNKRSDRDDVIANLRSALAVSEARVRELAQATDAMVKAVIATRQTERPRRLMGPTGANDAGKVLEYAVSAECMSSLNDAAITLQAALRQRAGEGDGG